jgi:voltage-gated sodium channel
MAGVVADAGKAKGDKNEIFENKHHVAALQNNSSIAHVAAEMPNSFSKVSQVKNAASSGGIFNKALRFEDCGSDEIKMLFQTIDSDNSGDINKTEFLRAFKTDDVVIAFCKARPALRPLLDHRRFKRAFESIDNDGSDGITLDEFRLAVEKITQSFTGDNEDEDGVAQIEMPLRSAFGTSVTVSALDEEVYDVEKLYWNEGLCQAIARSEYFQNFTLAVIVANAVYIGIEVEHNTSDHLYTAHWFFLISEFAFCVYFLLEWVVRFGAFENKLSCLQDGWFKFDSALVLLMVVETVIMPLFLSSASGDAPPTGALRLLRLSRLSRLVRLMRAVPELVTICKGMASAVRAVASTFAMVILLIYVFAILMLLLLRDDTDTSSYWSSLSQCMWTLLMRGIFQDSPGAMLDTMAYRGEFATITATVIFFIFVLLATITVMNLLVGVLVDVVSVVASSEKEEAATTLMKEKILYELKKFDDGDSLISEDELNEVMVDPLSVAVLEKIGVDVFFLQTLQVMTYEDPDTQVPIHEILDQMLSCRRQMPVTMKHLITQTHLMIWSMSNKILQHERRLEKNLDTRFEKLLREVQRQGPSACSEEESISVLPSFNKGKLQMPMSPATLSKTLPTGWCVRPISRPSWCTDVAWC